MSKLLKYAAERSERDPEFKAAFEAEMAVMELVRTRKARGVSQTDMAEQLHVSQPYLAQIESMTKKLNADLLFRYAAALGLSLRVVEPDGSPIREAIL